MHEPQIRVSITGYEFSLNDLRAFIDRCDGIEELPRDPTVHVKQINAAAPHNYMLYAQTESG